MKCWSGREAVTRREPPKLVDGRLRLRPRAPPRRRRLSEIRSPMHASRATRPVWDILGDPVATMSSPGGCGWRAGCAMIVSGEESTEIDDQTSKRGSLQLVFCSSLFHTVDSLHVRQHDEICRRTSRRPTALDAPEPESPTGCYNPPGVSLSAPQRRVVAGILCGFFAGYGQPTAVPSPTDRSRLCQPAGVRFLTGSSNVITL